MYMPWFGLFEQVKKADIYVHYDDVQLPTKSSVITRVQVKLPNGISWLTVPIERRPGGHARINEYTVAGNVWREKHLATLSHAYKRAPFFPEMYALAESILSFPGDNLALLNQCSIEKIAAYLGLKTRFMTSSSLDCPGNKTERLVAICRKLGAGVYVTGWGAKNYLEHEMFAAHSIEVYYPRYVCLPYEQLHGVFTQYVSILDLIAHRGPAATEHFASEFVHWTKLSEL
jgi:hypothetical protein